MKTKLKKELEDIRHALKQQGKDDPYRAEAADHLRKHIDDYLQTAPDATREERDNMLESIKKSIEQFEASHPNLGMLIEKFLDTLSNLGI